MLLCKLGYDQLILELVQPIPVYYHTLCSGPYWYDTLPVYACLIPAFFYTTNVSGEKIIIDLLSQSNVLCFCSRPGKLLLRVVSVPVCFDC